MGAARRGKVPRPRRCNRRGAKPVATYVVQTAEESRSFKTRAAAESHIEEVRWHTPLVILTRWIDFRPREIYRIIAQQIRGWPPAPVRPG
jgi:hypothetical protein